GRSARRDPLVPHEWGGVGPGLAVPHDEVQVASGGGARRAGARDELPGADLLTDVHADPARHDVRVAGVGAVAVLDADVVAPSSVPPRVHDGAGVSRVDRDAASARQVNAGVEGTRAVDRVVAPAEVRRDMPCCRARPSACTDLTCGSGTPLLFEPLE